MDSGKNLLVTPRSFLEMPSSLASRSDSINLFARRGNTFSGRTSNNGYTSRYPNKNRHSNNEGSSSDCGQYYEPSQIDRQSRGGHMPGWDNTRNRGKVLDHNKRYPRHQNKVKRNFVSQITAGSIPQNYDIGFKHYVCPNCKYPYNYFKNRTILCGRLPRVLTCGHTVCEDCIDKSLKIANYIRCSICLEVVMNDKKNLDYNHFVVGQITCSRNQNLAVDFSDIVLMSTGVNLQGSVNDLKINKNSEVNCGLGGCSNPGTVRCLDCGDVYCKKCDEALHNNGNHLLSHKRNDIEKLTYDLKKCDDHLMFEELYCINCEQNCCCYCMLEKHEGHSRSYLLRLNEDEEKQLKISYKVVSKRLQELQQSQQKIGKPDREEIHDVEFEISRRFADIHAELFKIERKLHLKAKEENNRNSALNEVNNIMKSNMETIKYLMMCVDRRSEMKLNLRGLLRKLKEMEKVPSILLIDEASDETKARLLVDEKVNELESYFKLEIPIKQFYKLVKADELTEINKNEKAVPNVENLENCRKPSQNGASSSCAKPVNPVKLKHAYKNEFEPQTVYITHMNSLNCFYVQFKKEDEQFNELMKEIKNYMGTYPPNVKRIDVNELYMARCLTDETEWGRVRVLEKVGDVDYKIKFIDFGNEKVVDRIDLKRISPSLAKRKPFAVQCKLDNLSQIPWTKNSHLQLANFLGVNREVIMFTKELSNNIYTVDLHIITSCGDLRSVSDLLVFGGYGALQADSEPPEGFLESKQLFSNSDKFVKGESYEVYMRYVVDPWNIYIQKVCYENSLSSLSKSMKTFYHMSKCDIHFPYKRSDVVVFYDSYDYGDWHRARILEVFNDKKNVNVLLLDWGRIVNVPWHNLRNLDEIFRTTECLVVNVKLADIHPHAGDWSHFNSSGGRKFLEYYSENKKSLKMLVSENDPLEVVLFEDFQTYDTNINALFVEKGLGCSTGKLSQTVNWLHTSKEEKDDENEYLPIYKDLIGDDSDEELQGVKSPVEIAHFDDPHSIYVSFVLMKAELQQLQEELQIHYFEKYDVQENWSVNDKVVVFDSVEKQYYRGIIKTIEQDMYYVFFLDRGDHMFVTKQQLRCISPYFSSKFPNMALKCHLAYIKPAGDSSKWSFMSIEWFQKLFEKHKDIYIKKVSDDDTKSSMPVTMWYSTVQQGTALEPSVRKFISIDKKVVKAGLAFYVINEECQKIVSELKTPEHQQSASTTILSDCVLGNEDFITDDCSEKSSPPLVKTTDPQCEEIQCEIKDWLPPQRIEKKEFNAFITCAETEGYLFVRDEELQPLYKEMEKNMKQHFDSIPKPKPFILHENQLVTIWSCNFWYRGVILSVINKKTAKAMMIDFGSDHIVEIDHLHNKIMYPEIPIMVSKIKLYDVHSKTPLWSDIDIDNLLNTISEYSRIVIQSSLKIDIPLADVYDEHGVCLNDKIVMLCPNLYRKNLNEAEMGNSVISSDDEADDVETAFNPENRSFISKAVTWKSIVEDELEEMHRKIKDYNYVRLPYSMPAEKVLMDITAVLDYRTVSLYVGNDESKEEFALLSKRLQEEASDLECLENCEVGMPCISLFEEDNLWYRAKILQSDQVSCGYVTVMYVDYGNFEIVKVTDLKPVKPEWLNFPAAFFIAKLNYRVLDSKNECYLLKHTQELAGKSKPVEIIEDEPLTIHIYEEEDDKLYYDIFVKNGVIQLGEQVLV